MRAAVGFTLIEVLVSLAIVALALGAGLKAAAIATDNSGELDRRTLARWVGKNQLAQLQVEKNLPPPGTLTGASVQGNTEFAWEAVIESTPNPNFRQATVSVQLPGDKHRLYKIKGFLVGQR